MPESAVVPFPADLRAAFPLDDLAQSLLESSLNGVALYLPIRDEAGAVVDFTIALLNTAAQRMLGQPARPGGTYLQHYPHTLETGVFAFHRTAFESGQPARLDVNYQGDGLDNYFQLSAQRVGQGLLVSFSDTEGHARTAVEMALRESQAREQAARAEAETQRASLHETFMQAPAMICIFAGPEHVFELVNPPYQRLVGNRPLLGRPIREAMPELKGQPIFGLLDAVYRTGEPFHANEMLVQLDHENAGVRDLQKRYYNFIYQPRRDAQGITNGILVFAYEVTEQVLAQLQVGHSQRLTAFANEELAAANEELQAANEEIRATNDNLFTTQLSLQELNQELEARVMERTVQAQAARAEAERQRENLYQVFEKTPASVAVLRGPTHYFDYVNPAYQALFPERVLLNRNLADALPETVEFGFVALLDQVFRTGEPFVGTELPLQVRAGTGELIEQYYTFTYQAYREAGSIVGVSILAFEVTPQVQARQQAAALQAEVSRRDAQLQALFEQAPVAIAVLRGPTFVVELANPGMCALWGHPLEEVLGLPLLTGMPELRGQDFDRLLEGVLATGVPYVAQEQPAQLPRRGQLAQLYVDFVYQPLRDSDGRITGVAVVATDVSEQVAARQLLAQANAELSSANQAVGARNQELAAANQQLTRTNQDLDNFVYAASHDLKQPVNNLTGLFGELRITTVFTDPDEEILLVPMIDEALRQLATTIDDLAAVGQAQQLPSLPPETVDLAELTQEVLQTLQPQVLAARARITTDFAARPTISYTRANLRTILLNLLSNSLKYTDPARPCRVHLSLWLEADRPVLLVEDNGLGFDLHRHRGELFHLFRRFHDHTEGTGVGLYLVNRIVQSHGGRVEVESEIGVGTTFRLFL